MENEWRTIDQMDAILRNKGRDSSDRITMESNEENKLGKKDSAEW